jgi:hypothetical protein
MRVARALNGWFAACIGVWLLFFAASGAAQPTKRVVVLEFKGPSAAAVRGHVLAALTHHSEVQVVSSKDAARTAQELSLTLNNADDLTRVAQELDLSAFIEGEVTKEGKNLRALVRVRNAATGEVVHEEPWTRKNKAQLKAVRANFWEIMGPHILATEAPPKAEAPPPEPEPEVAPEPVAVEQEEAPPEEPKPASEKSATHPALVVAVGPRLMWRVLNYEDITTLSNYKNDFASPGVNAAVNIAWYPGAHVRKDWVSDLGLELDADYTMGLKSKQGTQNLSTSAYRFDVGAVYRIPLDVFEPRLRVGYVLQHFDVEKADTLPSVSYGSVRFGLGIAMHVIEQLTLDANFSYFATLSTGDLGSTKYASDASARALEAQVGALIRIAGPFGLRIDFDFTRYYVDFGKSMNAMQTLPKTGTDDFRRLGLSFVFAMGGVN